MGRETEHDILKRCDTPGTFDHFAHQVRRAIRDAHHALDAEDIQRVLDRKNLPDPQWLNIRVRSTQRNREPFAEYLTPEVAELLGEAAAKRSLRDGLLLVNAFMPASNFDAVRRRALREAGVRRPSKKGTAVERDRWLDLLFLYLTEIENATPADLAKRFLFDGDPHEFGRNRHKAARLKQRVRDGIDSALGLLREHGVQI